MNSEERLVAQVALELLQQNATVIAFGQLALGDADDELKLPATVVWAKFESEEEGAPALPRSYTLSLELRGLPQQHPADGLDETFAAIGAALNTRPGVYPPTFWSHFDYYNVTAQSGSDFSTGETLSRKRDYQVFARLLLAAG